MQNLDQITESNTAIAAAIAAGTAMADPKGSRAGYAPYTVVPNGYTLKKLPIEEFPRRPKGTINVRDARSFIKLFNKHKINTSEIYAQLQPAEFLGVIDEYFGGTDTVEGQANWREHRIGFAIPLSQEWKDWSAISGKPTTQEEFAKFIENNLPDIVDPNNADLLQSILQFRRTLEGEFKSVTNLDNGNMAYNYVANSKAGEGELPSALKLMIPVFENDTLRAVDVRLRSKLQPVTVGNEQRMKLAFTIEMIRPHKVLEAAFKEHWGTIETQCERQILLGSPE
jgi:uncharacterized protein YfdQ (DUF2303 family)